MQEHKVKQAIGWFIGPTDWAFKSLVSHLIDALPEFEHRINKCGDLNILMAMDQFDFCCADDTIILHLDGNRWYEKEGAKFRVRKGALELGSSKQTSP